MIPTRGQRRTLTGGHLCHTGTKRGAKSFSQDTKDTGGRCTVVESVTAFSWGRMKVPEDQHVSGRKKGQADFQAFLERHLGRPRNVFGLTLLSHSGDVVANRLTRWEDIIPSQNLVWKRWIEVLVCVNLVQVRLCFGFLTWDGLGKEPGRSCGPKVGIACRIIRLIHMEGGGRRWLPFVLLPKALVMHRGQAVSLRIWFSLSAGGGRPI